MEQQPLYLLDRESPADRRRRQQRQQQSSCFSCLLVVISALIALIVLWRPLVGWWQQRFEATQGRQIVAMFPLQVQTDATVYRRHNLVRFQVQVTNPYGETVRLTAQQSYICYWPVPWAAKPARYVAEAKIRIPDPDNWPWQLDLPPDEKKPSYKHGTSYCIARMPFQITPQPPADIPPGLCVATWEADFPEGQAIRR